MESMPTRRSEAFWASLASHFGKDPGVVFDTRGHAPWACWDNAPVSAPRFLKYLQARGFGLIMTMLVKGQLIESANLNDPTHFRSNWSCTSGLNQGVGHQAQQWFLRQNG
jgi:hypothetical protein